MNGIIKLPGKWFTLFRPMAVAGGPFSEAPRAMFSLCLLEEPPRTRAPDVWYPIVDFSVPEDLDYLERALKLVFLAWLNGEMVYVGCMAGRGRTGLMLSIIAKILGQEHPVEYVREHYYNHAVETKTQYDFVSEYDPSALRRWVFWTVVRQTLGRPIPSIA